MILSDKPGSNEERQALLFFLEPFAVECLHSWCKESLRLLDFPHVFRHVSCMFQAWYTRGPARDVDLREGTSGAENAGFGNDKPFVVFVIISRMSFLWLIRILFRLSNMILRYITDEIRVPEQDFIQLPLLQKSKPPSNCVIVIGWSVQ